MPRYILWDSKDGHYPPRDSDGNINTGGIIGAIGPDNVYLTAYPSSNIRTKLSELEVGQRIQDVKYQLSGETGYYDIYRVE